MSHQLQRGQDVEDPTWVSAKGLLPSTNRRRELGLGEKAAALLVVTWPPVPQFPHL